jgi:glycosyltransferase involved in cell wall biosynthesis
MRIALRLGDADPSVETDSVFRSNAAIRDMLAATFEITDAEHADLVVVGGLTLEPPVGPPHVVIAHGAVLDPGHWSRTIPRLRRQDTLVVTSRSDEAVIAKLAGEPFCRVARLPLFVDTSFFRPRPELRRAAREELGLAARGSVLLTASVVVAEKNVHGAVHLLGELAKLRPDVELAIAGRADETYSAYLLDLARRRGVANRVRLLGALAHQDLLLAYNAADVFVHLGWLWKENFGLAVVEAQASGLPVVAASWDGFRDTVIDGQTGYLADTWLVTGGRRVHWPGLVGRCHELFDDRSEWAARARQHAVEEFSPTRFRERLITLLREAAAARPKSSCARASIPSPSRSRWSKPCEPGSRTLRRSMQSIVRSRAVRRRPTGRREPRCARWSTFRGEVTESGTSTSPRFAARSPSARRRTGSFSGS